MPKKRTDRRGADEVGQALPLLLVPASAPVRLWSDDGACSKKESQTCNTETLMFIAVIMLELRTTSEV